MVGRELAALLRHLEAAATSGEDDGRCIELVLAAGRVPAVAALLERGQGAVREERSGACLERVAKSLRDRMPGAVADLEQALGARAAAAGEAVAAVFLRECDSKPPLLIALRASPAGPRPAYVCAVRALEDVRRMLLSESSSPNEA
jgi:hypothetical protein